MAEDATSRRPVYPLALAPEHWGLPYLPLGMITSYLRVYQGGILNTRYTIHRVTPACGQDMAGACEMVTGHSNPIVLLSSYVWNHQANIDAARKIKQRRPAATVIIGGPEIPRFSGESEAFLANHPEIDIAVLGEGEISCAETLFALSADDSGHGYPVSVSGIAYRQGKTVQRTGDRKRLEDLNSLPSPYLTGEFEPWFSEFSNAMLETNRGCPFGCAYCDWGSATLQKVNVFDAERVIAEADYIARSRAEAIFITDANFGMLEQDIEISRALVEIKKQYGYPLRLNTNFTKNGGHRLMEVIRILHEGGLLPSGIIALQTTDQKVLEAIDRQNVRTESYETMMRFFNAREIPIASDLMIGLPEQTLESLAGDLQFCFDWKVSAHGNFTSMMPNAPMADPAYRSRYRVGVDSQGLVASTSSFSEADMLTMKGLYIIYLFFVRLGVLKYYLYFIQIDHGTAAMNILQRWQQRVLDDDPALPISCRTWRELLAVENRSGDWATLSWGNEAGFFFDNFDDFYNEFHDFCTTEFDMVIEQSVTASLRRAQSAVLPRLGRRYPWKTELGHDLVAYFNTVKRASCVKDLQDGHRPLATYPPGTLEVHCEKESLSSLSFTKVWAHSDEWELQSALRFY